MEKLWRAIRALIALQICACYATPNGMTLDLANPESIKNMSRELAASAMKYYDGNKPGGTPGMIVAAGDFNWWEAGALFGQMVEYWYYTGDNTYNDVTKQAMLWQAGPYANYEPENQTRTEGNDDQAFWAFAAMSAAELKFPNPDPKQPQWLALAQAVFNRQAARWDDKHCNGGLRWQFNPINNGFMEKNTISNGCFFQLAARLARYTKNDTYAQWATKSYEWIAQSSLINERYEVFDTIGFTETSCSRTPNPIQWSYNIGTMIAGTAFMYNYTNGAEIWKTRMNGFLDNTQKVFFPPQYGGKIMVEYACEEQGNCNKDQRSFKAYLARWLAVSVQLAPFSAAQIVPWLQTSAGAAVKACSGGPPGGVVCGRRWYEPQDDGTRDIGNQMTTMSVVQANLAMKLPGPADHNTGTSSGNAGGGGPADRKPTADDILATRKFTTGDKVGGWLITVVLLVIAGAWGAFLCSPDDDLGYMVNWYTNGASQQQWYRPGA